MNKLKHELNQHLISQIKLFLINEIDNRNDDVKIKLSVRLKNEFNKNPDYLNSIFKRETNETMKNFMIRIKIERAKTMLFNENKTLTQCYHELNFCSIAYLSKQFKQITKMNVNEFIEREINERIKKLNINEHVWLNYA